MGQQNRTHGLRKTPEYEAWCHMRKRCDNPKDKDYPNYGERGIVVCVRWQKNFLAFYQDMGVRPSPAHSIERRDNNGPYDPDNCYWGTKVEQMNNTRRSAWLTYNGETRTLPQWAQITGLPLTCLRGRYKSKKHPWTINDLLTIPVLAHSSQRQSFIPSATDLHRSA